uniref:Ring finger protein 175 n=1 Tax=Anas platyrhynchos TaxID=8839 RepID=A0A8B9QZZ1_ANAPL
MHAKYHGHKSMHREIVLVLVATLVVAQILLVQWKQRHCQSYNAISLSERQLFYFCPRGEFSVLTSYIIFRANHRPLSGKTLRLLYTGFILIYKLSYAIGVVGYSAMMLTMFGFNLFFGGIPTRNVSNNICGVCRQKIFAAINEERITENTYYILSVFHESCIRGWCTAGKKEASPYRSEKVDLKRMLSNPYPFPHKCMGMHLLYGTLLDWLCYLMAW